MAKDLLPCPFCGRERPRLQERYVQGIEARKHYRYECPGCHGTRNMWYRSVGKAATGWNRRPQQENRPLTVDELRGMDGEPVWIHWMDWLSSRKDCWAIVHPKNPEGTMWDFGAYGKTWLAYRSKPKEESRDERLGNKAQI